MARSAAMGSRRSAAASLPTTGGALVVSSSALDMKPSLALQTISSPLPL